MARLRKRDEHDLLVMAQEQHGQQAILQIVGPRSRSYIRIESKVQVGENLPVITWVTWFDLTPKLKAALRKALK